MLLNRLHLHMLPPRAILLTADVILLLLPEDARAGADVLSGRTPPYGTVAVQSESGSHRVAAMRLSDYRAAPDGSLLSFASDPTRDADLLDPLNTVILGSSVADFVDELDTQSQRRLLAFLLGFCGKAFAINDAPDYAAACLQLAQLCVPVRGTAEPVATVTPNWVVLRGLQATTASFGFILSQRRVRRSLAPPLAGFAAMRLSDSVAPGDVLLVPGAEPAQYVVGPARAGLPDLVRSRPDAAGLRSACLRALAPVCPQVAAQLREISLLAPAAVKRHDDVSRPIGAGLEAALPDGQGRLFLRGWIRDPDAPDRRG